MHKKILKSVIICLFYAICSMGFSFSAKFLFKIYAFNNTVVLLLYESTVNIVICTILLVMQSSKDGFNCFYKQIIGVQKKEDERKSIYESVRMVLKERFKQTIQTLPFSITYGIGVFLGMQALSIISIPMFLAIRRTLIFFVFIFGLLIGNSHHINISFAMAIIFISAGAIIAGLKISQHFNTNLQGYLLVIFNNCFSAISLHLAKQLNTNKYLEPLELVFNNSLNLWPVFFVLSIVTGDLQAFILNYTSLHNTEFTICFTLVAVFGFLLNYCTNLCVMRNSPFAIALTHNIKDIVSTSISIVVFTDTQLDSFLVTGISLSFTGSFIYTYTKMKEIQKELQMSIPIKFDEQSQQEDQTDKIIENSKEDDEEKIAIKS